MGTIDYFFAKNIVRLFFNAQPLILCIGREIVVKDCEEDPICLFFVDEVGKQIEEGIGLL